MKRLFFTFLGKIILYINPFLWNHGGTLGFNLHQKLNRFLIFTAYKHKLDLFED